MNCQGCNWLKKLYFANEKSLKFYICGRIPTFEDRCTINLYNFSDAGIDYSDTKKERRNEEKPNALASN